MSMKLASNTVLIIVCLSTALGCNNSEIEKLKQENKSSAYKILQLENENDLLKRKNSDMKTVIDRYNNPPVKLYLNAFGYEKSLQIEEAKSEYRKIIKWYPDSKEAEKAKIRLSDVEKGNKNITIFSSFKRALISKFAGSSKAILSSLKLMDNNIIISATHRDCDYDDIIFIDVGVAGYRNNRINKINFSKIILELHCGENRVSKHFVKKSDFLNYTNASINDTQFLRLIKQM